MLRGTRARVAAVCAAVVLGVGIGSVATADVCVKTDFGTNCAGPSDGGRTMVTAQVGCCVFVESTGAVALGRTGLQGTGVEGTRATLHLWANGFQTAHAEASPDSLTLHARAGEQTADVRSHVGCCVQVTASGPIELRRTGVYGNENEYYVLYDERERPLRCPHDAGVPKGCSSSGITVSVTFG